MLQQLTYPSAWLMVAPPNSGKSYFIRYMLTELLQKKKFQYGAIFSGSSFNDDYDWYDDSLVWEYSEAKLRKIVEVQMAAKERDGAFPPIFVVFDDCLGSNFATPWFVGFMSKYRHYNITLIFAIQRLKTLKSPIIYSCARYVVLFYNESDADIKTLYDNVATGVAASWRELKTLIAARCTDHACLIIDRACTDKTKKCIRYRAGKQKNLKFEFG